MKYFFKNADALQEGIELLQEDLGIMLSEESEAEITVTVTETERRSVAVTLDGFMASITYGGGKARFFRGLATLVSWVKKGETVRNSVETPLFRTNGAMVDMSRNAVMNVKTVKAMLRAQALMGLNMYMLYTEDTYEIESRPYFGYMRGRYTKAEIRELDAYAQKLGIELIPCVQMLGHLATHLKWMAAGAYKDTENALLVGADATYRLIEDMLESIKDAFSSRRIHVGMDETHDLGTGSYMKLNGYRERQEIYFEHLKKVIELTRAHGFEPMMWSDMFFRLAGKGLKSYRDYDPRVEFTDEVIGKVPKGIQQVFWDYYSADESFYAVNLEKHDRVFGKGALFAGGVWTWSGHCPLYSRSFAHTIPALEACRKNAVEEIFATVWLNGAECSLVLGLLGLAWYADYDYRGGYDLEGIKECFENACGVPYDTVYRCELPERPDGGRLSLTRAFLYNDPLIGLSDKHIEGLETRTYYEDVTARLSASAVTDGIFAPAYDTILRLSDLLINKADFGVRLKKAYDAADRAALSALAEECDVITEKLRALRQSHKNSWMEYNKPFGWEVLEIRYGGLLARFETAEERIRAYLSGALDSIEELEAERLRLDGQLEEDASPRFHSKFLWTGYRGYATPGTL